MIETTPSNGTEIFISYSEKDKNFVKKLYQVLQQQRYKPWIQSLDLQPGHPDWWGKILRAIQRTNTLVFVMSADSLKSEWCLKEIRQAKHFNKRVFVVNYGRLSPGSLAKPSKLDQETWVWLNQTNWFPYDRQNEEATFEKLLNAIETDFEYAKKHAGLAMQADEWIESGRREDYLLRGDLCWDVWNWLENATETGREPKPTSDIQDFILASASYCKVKHSENLIFKSYEEHAEKLKDVERMPNLLPEPPPEYNRQKLPTPNYFYPLCALLTFVAVIAAMHSGSVLKIKFWDSTIEVSPPSFPYPNPYSSPK
jgi:TIR domain